MGEGEAEVEGEEGTKAQTDTHTDRLGETSSLAVKIKEKGLFRYTHFLPIFGINFVSIPKDSNH